MQKQHRPLYSWVVFSRLCVFASCWIQQVPLAIPVPDQMHLLGEQFEKENLFIFWNCTVVVCLCH